MLRAGKPRLLLRSAGVLLALLLASTRSSCCTELHDVGKIGVPDAVLDKPGPLDETEWTS